MLRQATKRWYSTNTTQKYKVGSKIAGFRVKDVQSIPRLNLTAVNLQHKDTGARHLHVDRDDDNNVFSIGFKTNPPDHTGVPHILEHTTLCGSHTFPVKDPFFSMLTRSLSNFMNAMTGLDYTFYPFATTNEKDFANLQRVYLDSVYNPLLREADFRQEGWRLEHEVKDDPNSKVIFKGVVYNEMKGMMSDPGYVFTEQWLQSIYSSLNSSGGDPKHITELKYEDLKQFHHTRYHPSNAFTYSYGKMNLESILKPVQEAIKGVKKLDVNQTVLEPVEMKKDTVVEVDGPKDPLFDESRQTKASLSWVVCNTNDTDSLTVWRVLSLLLIYGHSSPLYKALIDSGLGSDFAANTGLHDLPGKAILSIGLQGLKAENIQLFKQKVDEVLKQVAEHGLPAEHLEAIINLVELSQREVEANYGMQVCSKIMPRIFNGVDNPFSIIDEETMLERFKKMIKDEPHLFQQKVKDLLAKHRFEFVMNPDAEFESKALEEEQTRLQNTIEKESVHEFEETPKGDESVLPVLSVDEIATNKPAIPVERFNELYARETSTQGLTYTSMLKNLANVPADLRPLLPLFASAMTNMGLYDMPMDELENKIRLTTGGIDSSLHLCSDPEDVANFGLHLNLAGSSLDSKSFHMYDFFNRFLTQVKYKNVEKLRTLIQASAANAMGELSQSGNAYAVRHASAAITAKRRLDNDLSGIDQVRYMQDLSKLSDEKLASQVVPKLEQIAEIVATKQGIVGGVTYTPGNNNLKHNLSLFEDLVGGLPMDKVTMQPISDVTKLDLAKTHYELPFGISFAGVSLPGVSYTHHDAAPLRVLCSLLTYRHLHQEIREKGGAYGAGASYNSLDGLISFFSYRDPNPLNSVATIQKSGEWAASKEFTQSEIDSAKLTVFQGIDSPISPRSEIAFEYLHGLTNEMRNEQRKRLLAVSSGDVKRVAEKYLIPGLANHSSATILGPALDSYDDSWSRITM